MCNCHSVYTSDLRQLIPAHRVNQKLVQRSGKGFVYRLPLLEYISSIYTRSAVPIWKSSKREGIIYNSDREAGAEAGASLRTYHFYGV